MVVHVPLSRPYHQGKKCTGKQFPVLDMLLNGPMKRSIQNQEPFGLGEGFQGIMTMLTFSDTVRLIQYVEKYLSSHHNVALQYHPKCCYLFEARLFCCKVPHGGDDGDETFRSK